MFKLLEYLLKLNFSFPYDVNFIKYNNLTETRNESIFQFKIIALKNYQKKTKLEKFGFFLSLKLKFIF